MVPKKKVRPSLVHTADNVTLGCSIAVLLVFLLYAVSVGLRKGTFVASTLVPLWITCCLVTAAAIVVAAWLTPLHAWASQKVRLGLLRLQRYRIKRAFRIDAKLLSPAEVRARKQVKVLEGVLAGLQDEVFIYHDDGVPRDPQRLDKVAQEITKTRAAIAQLETLLTQLRQARLERLLQRFSCDPLIAQANEEQQVTADLVAELEHQIGARPEIYGHSPDEIPPVQTVAHQ